MATIPGDFNLDGTADSTDKSIWFANAWTGTTWAQGDANYDGVVDGRDRDILLANISRSVSGSGSPSLVVSPASDGAASDSKTDDPTASSPASQSYAAADGAIQSAHDAVFNGLAEDPDNILDGVLADRLVAVV